MALILILFLPSFLGAELYEVRAHFDWTQRELVAQASLDLNQAGLRIPTGRFQAEELLDEAYPRLLIPYLLGLPLDSSTTVHNLFEGGELNLRDLDSLARGAQRTAPNLSADLSRMNSSYRVSFDRVASYITSHRGAAHIPAPLIPSQTAEYTGIIIIAQGELPVWGRQGRSLVQPCLFPRIWDSEMNLIYDRYMLDPTRLGGMVQYTAPEGIFASTPSGLAGDLAALVGNNPLRIFAREVFGILPTDPVIDRADALLILSSEHNRTLLQEGRVIMVLNEEVLWVELSP